LRRPDQLADNTDIERACYIRATAAMLKPIETQRVDRGRSPVQLRDLILSGEYVAEDKLHVAPSSQELGVNRSSCARLKKLELWGWSD